MNEKKNKIFVKIKHCVGLMVHAKNCLKKCDFQIWFNQRHGKITLNSAECQWVINQCYLL